MYYKAIFVFKIVRPLQFLDLGSLSSGFFGLTQRSHINV
ncbi:hypothetical protein [uncultured Gammaproteobacteria bacterium]|nr:hypothetical protein [uncultured Gammaproteobacteria bacterium]CAC9502899.1 hypothetical protein [uncultured Gammaproteobacteria bacterium]CAC9511801.1 hypothetical protein [uncultured Gammaproteobacteria bacterium]CAC9517833.1 hypothetical protein [uncultured Gammaproteobacteria bacterium]CAC9524491.1 hypothetical protein [uncultured Gammaproteobacteria bacterium]